MTEFLLSGLIIVVLLVSFIFIGYKNHVADWNHFIVNVVDGWIRIYCRYYHNFIYQPIPVSNSGPTLLACNHLSGLDPFLMVAACQHPIRFMIAKEEYERFGMQWLFRLAGCIPVERSGRVEKAFRLTLSALRDGEVVGLFPEGSINRTGRPLQRLKPGIIKLAKMADVPITALRVEGMRRQGHTVSPLFFPSQSRLYVLPELECTNMSYEEGLTQLALFLAMKK